MTVKLKVEGVSKGALESYTFPSKSTVEKDEPWSATVRNIGDLGSIALGIVNVSSNPSTIIIIYGGTEYTIELGYYLRILHADVPNNGVLSVNGDVRFDVAGTYSIKLWAMHLEGTTWTYDQEIVKSVIVAPVIPPPETIWDKIKKSIGEHPLEYAVVAVGGFLGWTALSRPKKE